MAQIYTLEQNCILIMDMPLIRDTQPSQPDNKIIMLLSHKPYSRDTVVSFNHSERNIIPPYAINNMMGLLDRDSDSNIVYLYTWDSGPPNSCHNKFPK